MVNGALPFLLQREVDTARLDLFFLFRCKGFRFEHEYPFRFDLALISG